MQDHLWLSTFDRWGCPDFDEDGWSDPTPYWLASPGGTADAWPEDPTQWHDRDGDGRGDNPSGTTADVCPSQPGTSVGPSSEATAGVALTQMVTVGRILVMRSFMNQHNGEIRTVTATVTKPMEMRQMHVQHPRNSILDRLGCRDTDGDGGLTQPMAGTLIRTVQRTPSRPKPCNGRTAMVMDLVMCLSVLYEMTVPKRSEPQRETYKGARTTTAMVGRMNMVNGMLLLPSWVRTLQHHG